MRRVCQGVCDGVVKIFLEVFLALGVIGNLEKSTDV
jgi:hypothetical protein